MFLRAEWRNLVLLNYTIEEAALKPYVPAGTELDRFDGRLFASLVAFQFLRTRVFGMPIPFHVNFPEVNLRFYVRRRGPDGWRRGVVFVKELVPRWAIATVARYAYNENYVAVPMTMNAGQGPDTMYAQYRWQTQGVWHGVQATAQGAPAFPQPDDHAAFIVEHYFGYTKARDGGTLEYGVEHPAWRVWTGVQWDVEGAPESVYPPVFAEALRAAPYSAVMAEGSGVLVRRGVRLGS